MSRFKRILATLFLAVFAGVFVAHMAAAAPFSTGVGGTGTTTPFGILVGDGTAGDPLKTLLLSGCTLSGNTLTCNSGGGAGTGTISTSTPAVIGNLLYFTSPNQVGNVGTTTASCAGTASCSAFTIIGTTPVTITGSGGGTSFAYPFINSATTSTLTLNGGFVVNAASTTFTNSPFFTVLTGGTVNANPNGSLYGGATTTVSCGTGASCSTFTTFGSTPVIITATGTVFPFTPNVWGNATGTTIGFQNGLISNASSTFSGSLWDTNLAGGNLFIGQNGQVLSEASSSLFGYTPLNPTRNVNTSSPLTGGGALTADLTLGCQTASGSQAGCLSSTDWNTFNGKDSFPYPFPGGSTTTIITFTNGLTGNVTGNVTGSAGSVANALTINNSGSGAASGSTFNGSSPITISYNTIGAQVAGNYANFAYPFINSATSSTLTFTGGFVNNSASTTFTNSPFFTSLVGGTVNSNPNGSLYNQATTSVTCTGSTSCSGFTVFGSSPITINSTGGAGGAAGTWSTTTSQVLGELINYSNNNSDVVGVGGNSTSTAAFYVDPNQVAGPFEAIGATSTPFARLAIDLFGNAVHANTAFFVGSTTPTGATTTLFSIDAQGNIQTTMTGTSCVHEINGILSAFGSDCGTGTVFPFTPNVWGNGTSTVIGFNLGLISQGSTTLSSLAGTAAGSFIAVDPTGKIIATTTPSGGSSSGAVSIPVQLATTGALPANTYAGGVLTEVGTGALTVDGTAAVVGNRVLVKNEVAQTNNGIYSVTAAGSGIAAYVLTRVSDYNSSANVIPGEATYVIGGATLNDDWWALQTVAPITVGGGGSGSNLTYLETNAAGVTAVTGAYPIISSGGSTPAISLAFGTTTANTWSSTQVFNGNVGIGTTSPATILQLFSTGTTTESIDSNSATQGGCIQIKNRNGVGYTYIYAQSGQIFSTTVSCK